MRSRYKSCYGYYQEDPTYYYVNTADLNCAKTAAPLFQCEKHGNKTIEFTALSFLELHPLSQQEFSQSFELSKEFQVEFMGTCKSYTTDLQDNLVYQELENLS